MQKLLAVYVVVTVIFCGLAFGSLSALRGSSTAADSSPVVESDASNRVAKCVVSVLRDQQIASKAANKADEERFVRVVGGMPRWQVEQLIRMMPPPPTVAEVEYARNQQLVRIKELCRLRISAASE
jgi:hypothetical protein